MGTKKRTKKGTRKVHQVSKYEANINSTRVFKIKRYWEQIIKLSRVILDCKSVGHYDIAQDLEELRDEVFSEYEFWTNGNTLPQPVPFDIHRQDFNPNKLPFSLNVKDITFIR